MTCIKDLSHYRDLVTKTTNEKKFFRLISQTRLGTVCKELRKRGFLEVIVIPKQCILSQLTLMQLCQEASDGNEYEKALVSKLIAPDILPNFVWLSKQSQYKFFNGTQHVNRIEFFVENFTIKHNMLHIGREIEEKYGCTFQHPRAYEITNDKDVENFETEYDWTLITSFILLVNRDFCVSDDRHALSTEAIDIALSAMKTGFLNGIKIVEKTYRELIQATNAGERRTFYGRQLTKIHYSHVIRVAANEILTKWPTRTNDGYQNVWIVKPSLGNRGEGILVTNDKQQIINYIYKDDEEYVVQKYIENPLLIYDAKFDIRQYFVITIDDRLFCGWAHPRCHIKLASNTFTLSSFDESVHVTNITVQKKYMDRTSENLPRNHVWSVEDLDEFLTNQTENRKPKVFQRIIFPQMKKILKQICAVSRKNIEMRAGRFEIFGCDWMINEDMEVQLLEINRGPSLENLTPKSTEALEEVLVDLVKSKGFLVL